MIKFRSSPGLTIGTSKVSPLEQKLTILIQPKEAKASAACIAYSAKLKEKSYGESVSGETFIQDQTEKKIQRKSIKFYS